MGLSGRIVPYAHPEGYVWDDDQPDVIEIGAYFMDDTCRPEEVEEETSYMNLIIIVVILAVVV